MFLNYVAERALSYWIGMPSRASSLPPPDKEQVWAELRRIAAYERFGDKLPETCSKEPLIYKFEVRCMRRQDERAFLNGVGA